MHLPTRLAACALLIAAPLTASAVVYTSEAAFIADVGTAKASLPSTLGSVTNFSAAPFSFESDPGQTFVIDTSVYGKPIPDEDNLLLSGFESQTLMSSVPLYAFGFKIYQPSNASPSPGPNGVACYFPCDIAPFNVRLYDGATLVASFSFTPAYDTIEFHGYAGTTAFDKIRIEDTSGSIDDEYFATYRYGIAPIPEPATWSLLAIGLAGLVMRRRLRNAA